MRTESTPTGPVHDGRMMVLTEKRVGHDEAIDRLGQIAVEAPGATFLLIDGWPALQRRMTATVVPPTVAKGEGGPPERVIVLTTAVAAEDIVVRAEGSPPARPVRTRRERQESTDRLGEATSFFASTRTAAFWQPLWIGLLGLFSNDC